MRVSGLNTRVSNLENNTGLKIELAYQNSFKPYDIIGATYSYHILMDLDIIKNYSFVFIRYNPISESYGNVLFFVPVSVFWSITDEYINSHLGSMNPAIIITKNNIYSIFPDEGNNYISNAFIDTVSSGIVATADFHDNSGRNAGARTLALAYLNNHKYFAILGYKGMISSAPGQNQIMNIIIYGIK